MRTNLLTGLFALLISSFIFTASGCGDCAQVRGQCEAAINAEQKLATLQSNSENNAPTHFAVAFKDSALDPILNSVLQGALSTALKITEKIKVSSNQSIAIKAKPTIAALQLRADKACDNCLRLGGSLDGTVTVTVPIIGTQSVPLDGSLSLVAPIIFAPSKSADAAIQLDLPQIAKIGKSTLSAELRQLPPTWSRALQAPLTDRLLAAASERLKPVTLFEFDAPDLGIEGLKIVPAAMKTDAASHSIYLGFASNLPGVNTSAEGIQPNLNLKGSNFAFAVHPSVVTSTIGTLMRQGKISRTYTDDGKAATDGPFSVTMSDFNVSPSTDSLNYDLGFRAWKLPNSGTCFWADAVAKGNLALKDGELNVSVSNVELTKSSLGSIATTFANWTTASFIEENNRFFKQSLGPDMIKLPNGQKLKTKHSALSLESNGLWVRSKASVQ